MTVCVETGVGVDSSGLASPGSGLLGDASLLATG